MLVAQQQCRLAHIVCSLNKYNKHQFTDNKQALKENSESKGTLKKFLGIGNLYILKVRIMCSQTHLYIKPKELILNDLLGCHSGLKIFI